MSNNGSGAQDALDAIIKGCVAVVTLSNDDRIGIRICNGKSLPDLLRFASTLSADLGLELNDPKSIKEKLLVRVNDVSFIFDLMAKYTKEVYGLLASMTTLQTISEVEELPIDDLVYVLTKTVEVNQNFFMTRVLPMLKARQVGKTP